MSTLPGSGTFRTLVVSVFAGIILGLNVGVAWAAQATSQYYYFGPIGGHSYDNFSWLSDTAANCPGGHVCSLSSIETQSGGNVPAGYMGAFNDLYKNQALCKDAGWFYNNYSIFVEGAESYPGCGAGNYNSQGQTAAWNGTTYKSQYTWVTPTLTYSG